ncbi:MAG TPA: IclR family transcriptional regulator [Candidatus Dormibacteraeota bacterium]|nr:IclR family transcriptional regulator [Candidatus Dormibacteraeota bacterium]
MPGRASDTAVPTARALAVLDYVAEQGAPASLADIAAALGMTPPTAHRIAVQLEERGYLQRALGSRRFVIGPQLARLGLNAVNALLRDAPRHAILQSLADEIGEHCELGIMAGNEIVYVDSIRTARPASLNFEPGKRSPLHCTSTGKLFLSHMPPRLRGELVHALALTAYTPNTITDPGQLLAELAVVRERGWATSNEEYVSGVVGCAVPVYGPRKRLMAGLAVSVPVARRPFAELNTLIPALQSASARLSTALSAS